jgi:hypothetical protein
MTFFWSFICATAKKEMTLSSLKLMYLLVIGLLSLGLMLERSMEIKLVLGQKLCNISRQIVLLLNVVCAVTAVGS